MSGAYFVTLCTYSRASVLAHVQPAGVRLTTFGRIVAQEWHQTALLRPYVRLDAFVVMPDHVHGVLWLVGPDATGSRGAMHGAPTAPRGSGPPVSDSASTIVAMFKAAVTRRVNRLLDTPAAPFWQRNFYEHVVRGPADLNRIRQYVAANPARWLERYGPS